MSSASARWRGSKRMLDRQPQSTPRINQRFVSGVAPVLQVGDQHHRDIERPVDDAHFDRFARQFDQINLDSRIGYVKRARCAAGNNRQPYR